MDSELAFNIGVPASGSTGNSPFIETNQRKVLVDAGLGGRKITSLSTEINRKLEDLDAVLVTHERRDHIHDVDVLTRKYKLDVYTNEKTWQAMDPMIGKVDVAQKRIFEMGKVLTLGDMDIESFGVSHDAIAPQLYRFHRDNRSFVVLTDIGYCSDRIRGTIENADTYLVESSHEIETLRAGPHPWSLRQWILGDKGHLSNDDGALVMADMLGDKTKRIYLDHLSREGNTRLHARMAMKSTLKQKDLGVGGAFRVYNTDPDPASELF